MALSKWERKARLGFGAVTEIAEAMQLSKGHVSQVVSGNRRDRKVEVVVARRLRMPVAKVFAQRRSA